VNWDPKKRLDTVGRRGGNEPHSGSLWHLRYRAEDGGPGVSSRRRARNVPADVAVAVHPEDERYAALIGKNVVLPL